MSKRTNAAELGRVPTYWESFSLPVVRASGEIVIRGPHGKAFDPVAHLTLSKRLPRGEGETYKHLGYRLSGHLPPGAPRRGGFRIL